jgi:tetratricopeptide (TPR) repeat protein
LKSNFTYIKYGTFVISIPIIVYFLFTSINNITLVTDTHGQAASPNFASIPQLINNGNTLAAQGNYNGAISFYDKVLAIDPNNIKALYNKGKALSQLGNYVKSLNNAAISYYDKVLSLQPNNVGALYNKGNALVKLGNYNGAMSSFDKVLSINSTNAKALKGKSDVQAKIDKQKGTTISPSIASIPTTKTK